MDEKKRKALERAILRYAGGGDAGSMMLPYILNVSKGKLDAYIEKNFRDICGKVKDTGILMGNLGWIRRFQEAGIKVYGDYGLNVYNSQSQQAFEEMGVEILAWSHEAEESSFGDIPLMITEHPIPHNAITDRKDKKYDVLRCASGDKTLIFGRQI